MTPHQRKYLLLHCRINGQDHDQLLMRSEASISTLGVNRSWRRKLFYLTVECLQNVYRHSACLELSEKNPSSFFMIGKDDTQFFIKSENLIENSKVSGLRERIDYINQLDEEGLFQYRQETIMREETCEGGGANLGLIEMARKSGGKIGYNFQRFSNTYSKFTLRLNFQPQN